MSKTPDRRITVSIAADLADDVDSYVNKTERTNRSEVVEQALRLWERLSAYDDKEDVLKEALRLYEEQQERELYRAYYAGLTDEERADDSNWTSLSMTCADEQWKNEPAGEEKKSATTV